MRRLILLGGLVSLTLADYGLGEISRLCCAGGTVFTHSSSEFLAGFGFLLNPSQYLFQVPFALVGLFLLWALTLLLQKELRVSLKWEAGLISIGMLGLVLDVLTYQGVSDYLVVGSYRLGMAIHFNLADMAYYFGTAIFTTRTVAAIIGSWLKSTKSPSTTTPVPRSPTCKAGNS